MQQHPDEAPATAAQLAAAMQALGRYTGENSVPGQSYWPQNPPFDANLALFFAGSTCLHREIHDT